MFCCSLNVAILKGAKQIYLLGYDYTTFDNRHHYHDAYDCSIISNWNSLQPVWARHYEVRVFAIVSERCSLSVINTSRCRSPLPYFRKMPIEQALKQ